MMTRVLRWPALLAVLSLCALALVVGGEPSASVAGGAAPGPGATLLVHRSSPTTLQDQALQAVAGSGGAGPLTAASAVGPVRTLTVTTADGPIAVSEWTVVASSASGPVVLELSWLGGTQLVVTALGATAGSGGEALVLAPGGSTVQGRYPLDGSQGIATTSAVLRSAPGSTARLASVDGCSGWVTAPTVIGSVFGPLIDGAGTISCGGAQTLAMIVGLYEWGSSIGGGTKSAYASSLGLTVYHACSPISGSNAFSTAMLWSVNGSRYGATSPTSYLACA